MVVTLFKGCVKERLFIQIEANIPGRLIAYPSEFFHLLHFS